MEDDDEFGDLYSDVLKPFESSTAPPPPPYSTPTHLRGTIDLNLNTNEHDSLEVASQTNTLSESLVRDSVAGNSVEGNSAFGSKVSESQDLKLPDKTLEAARYEASTGNGDEMDMTFDIEEGDTENGSIIPGLSVAPGGESLHGSSANQEQVEGSMKTEKDNNRAIGDDGGGEEGDDWDSDSEDDLQIVLNDNNPNGMMGAEGGNEDDDEDLVIVADMDPNQTMDEQQWGEDGALAGEGDKKDAGELGKSGGGGAGAASKIGYSGHGYHPFYSQYKYVRPGAAAMPGGSPAGPGGAPGQVRPPVNMGPMAGRGRGDWRPPGMKNSASTQKGFGTPWGANAAGRGFGVGLDFTLPSHKTIFEVDIDSFEEKPWKYPGVEVTDFFNFGLNEDSWKEYCKQLDQHRMATTMQGRIRVYESGRTDQGYDPELPPELAAAAGIVPAETANIGKPDVGQRDLTTGNPPLRPPLLTGRPIPAEPGSSVERLPSIDTRPPRYRDPDTIIEIVCDYSFGDESSDANGEDTVDPNRPRESHSGDAAYAVSERPREGSCPSPNGSDKRLPDKQDEESNGSMDGRVSVPSSSPAADRAARSSSLDNKEDTRTEVSRGSLMEDDEHKMPLTGGKLTLREDDGGDSRPGRSSESSKGRSGGHRDYHKSRDAVEEEVIQDKRMGRATSNKKHLDEDEKYNNRRTHDGRHEIERNHTGIKGSREDLYSHGDFDLDRRKERGDAEVAWRRKGDELYNRQVVDEGPRKRGRGDDIPPRHRNKAYESEIQSKTESLHFRKQLDDGSSRVYNDKDVGSRHKEKDDYLRSSYDVVDDSYSKRKRDDEYSRRSRADKNEIIHGQRESVSRLKRERDDRFDHQKRDTKLKIRDDIDEQRSLRHKEELYLQKDGGERHREREELDNSKQISEKNAAQGRERSRRVSEDRMLPPRSKDEHKASEKEYNVKETARHDKHQKRRDHVKEESSSRHRGHEDVFGRSNQFVSSDKKPRQERSSTRNDLAIDASDAQRVDARRHKEIKRDKESESRDVKKSGLSRSKQGDQKDNSKEMAMKGTNVSGKDKRDVPGKPKSSKNHKLDASSDDEQQDSRRGRSKLERWTSQKDREFIAKDKNADVVSTEVSKLGRDSVSDKNQMLEEKRPSDLETRDAPSKPAGDRHLDTFEKLKKRSERFKLPMPNDKDGSAVKKTETDAPSLPSATNDTPAESEVKPERPARKRRWTSS